MALSKSVVKFIKESNSIEGLHHTPRPDEIQAYEAFIALPALGISHLQQFVSVIQRGAVLRDRPGLDVRVGAHKPPCGGPDIREELRQLLKIAEHEHSDPYIVHRRYETLHPFTDGNGRSGRAIWLWQMLRKHRPHRTFIFLQRGFLHSFYYQALENDPERQL